MEKISSENMLQAEQGQREASIATLENTEGFCHLTERQQRIIKQSLYLQARAERGTDYASASAIESPKTHVTRKVRIIGEQDLERHYTEDLGPDPAVRKYRDSQNHIVDWYCHAAIANLEREKGLALKPEALPEGFFETEYRQIDSFEDLKKWLEELGFPAVVHVNPNMFSQHSFLALGHNKEGKIVTWDKEGYHLSYRVMNLEDVYKEQDKGSSWGLRKLKVSQVGSNEIAA